ncbi:uncharacterized protein Triagg1_6057 [Trichoderma aggressivum f. europaeum]|uniref:Uncharacterized protein n=1 Tax=Trichoderma aggressivum f. europaeum TaxID=173218 RepID=A0AAE1IFJ0_9HYPO|nr:hypothetical protein Triagg1_6057 [Trichoderma aggressivum f. europaeum]
MLPAAREPTPGRVANPQFDLTAKGCLAVQTPLPLASYAPKGAGTALARQGTCTGRLSGTSYAPATVPSTVQVHAAAVLESEKVPVVTNWQRSVPVPHPELVLVHSEP